MSSIPSLPVVRKPLRADAAVNPNNSSSSAGAPTSDASTAADSAPCAQDEISGLLNTTLTQPMSPQPAQQPSPPPPAYQKPEQPTHHVAAPVYLPMPGPVFTPDLNDGGMHYDGGATNAAQMNVANINGGIRANQLFAEQRAGGDIGNILRWDLYAENGTPSYNVKFQSLGLPRAQFERIVGELHSAYLAGSERINWTELVMCGIFFPPSLLCAAFSPPKMLAGEQDDMNRIIPRVNRELADANIPIAFKFKIHWQLRPVLHEITAEHVPF